MEEGGRTARRLVRDDAARASFAVMGVILLVMGSMSTVYITTVNREQALDSMEESTLSRMRTHAALVHEEVATAALYHGSSAVYTATQVHMNQTRVVPLFNKTFTAYMDDSFPRTRGDMSVDVEGHSVGVFFSVMNTREIVPSCTPETITLRGREDEYEARTVNCDDAGEFNETSTLAYYTISGQINYTIWDHNSGRLLKKSMYMSKRLDSAYPLLHSKLSAMDASTKGTSSPVARTVKYILTTLAQYRVLQGYGMGASAGEVLNLPEKTTEDILTAGDAELAVNIALLLETARQYRTYDPSTLAVMDESIHNPDRTGDLKITELVKQYVTNGTVDAADIIAIYLGMEQRELNLEAIFAQALNAIADQFILKYLDYFHVMDIGNAIFNGVQSIAAAIAGAGQKVGDFLGWTAQESSDEDNYQQVEQWVKGTLTEDSGLPGPYVMHDTGIFLPDKLFNITLTKSGSCLHWEDTDNNPATPHELVSHPWTATADYEVRIPQGHYSVDFNEMDILRDDVKELWYDENTKSDFHDSVYGPRLNRVYADIRDVVQAVIGDVVREISSLVNVDLSSMRSLARPGSLNPKDDMSLLEEVRKKVNDTIDALSDHFEGDDGRDNLRHLITALVDDHANSIARLQNFISSHFDELADRDNNLRSARERLVHSLVYFNAKVHRVSLTNDSTHEGCVPPEPFSDSEVLTRLDLHHDSEIESEINDHVLQAYENVKNEELDAENDHYIIGGLEDGIEGRDNVIIDLFTNTVHGFGMIPMACAMVRCVLDDIIYDQKTANTKFLGFTKVGIPFEFWKDEYDPDNLHWETLRVDQSPDFLADGEDLDITVAPPRGTHYTSLGEFSTKPFATNWEVHIKGDFLLETITGSRVFLGNGTHEFTRGAETLNLNISCTITVYSGWDLEGVDYSLSNDLLGDIMAFLNRVWEYFASVLGAVYDTLMKIAESVVNLLTRLMSYMTEIVKVIMNAIQFFIELLEGFIQTVLDSIMARILEAVAAMARKGLTFTVFGITFTVRGDMDTAKNSSADGDLLTLATKGNIVGVDMDFVLRIARYHTEEDSLPHYDVLLDGDVRSGDFELQLAVDPLMKINSYIVEGHGVSAPENGTGWGIDFYAPEIEEYKEVRYCLNDLTKGMNSIPIPFLGLRATVDAGFIIQYNAPKGDSAVINEFEQNPGGEDNGTEWFEIYDPQGNVTGDWRVRTIHGGAVRYRLSSLPCETDGLYTVYTLPENTLSNGDKTESPSYGDGLILEDEQGNVIDRTPVYKEPGRGGNRTWQRIYDGSVVWKLTRTTRCVQNGPPKVDMKAMILDALKDSFNRAYSVFKEKELGLDSVIELVQDWIRTFIDMAITVIADVVQKVYIYFDLCLEDMSGSGGGGIRLSLGIDGIGLEALLRWLVDTVETFIYNILNPSNPESYPTLPKSVPEHMYVRFGVYLFAGTPKVVQKLGDDAPQTCTLMMAVSANLPALASLLGHDWGDWEVVFGVYLDHFPSRALSKSLGTSDDKDTFVDLWFLKARVYELC